MSTGPAFSGAAAAAAMPGATPMPGAAQQMSTAMYMPPSGMPGGQPQSVAWLGAPPFAQQGVAPTVHMGVVMFPAKDRRGTASQESTREVVALLSNTVDHVRTEAIALPDRFATMTDLLHRVEAVFILGEWSTEISAVIGRVQDTGSILLAVLATSIDCVDVVKLRQDLDMLHLVTNQGEQVRAYLVDTDRVGSATVSRGWRPGRPQGQAPGAMLVPAANLVWPSVGKDLTWVPGHEGQRSPLLILPDPQSDLVQRYFFGNGASNASYLFCNGLGVQTSVRQRNLPEALGCLLYTSPSPRD